jgi:hypothetical protein
VGHQEPRVCGKPANLDFILKSDKEMIENEASIIENTTRAYDKIDVYLKRFDSIRENYKTNLKANPDEIREQKGAYG